MISLTLYPKQKAEQILSDNHDLIENICASYHLPPAYLKAIILMELPMVNLASRWTATPETPSANMTAPQDTARSLPR